MQDQAVGFRFEMGCEVMELIRKSDAMHAVLHNQGDAAVAAVENIKPIARRRRARMRSLRPPRFWTSSIRCA